MSKSKEIIVDVSDADIKIDGKIAEVKLHEDSYKRSFEDEAEYQKALEIAKHNAKYYDAATTAVGALSGSILKDNKDVETVNASIPFMNEKSAIRYKTLREATIKIPGTENTVTKPLFTAKLELSGIGSKANVKKQAINILDILDKK